MLANHTAGRQKQRVFFIHRIAAGTPLRYVEVGLAVVRVELPVNEKAGRPRVIKGWARPENPHLFVHSLVGDAVVVGHAATRGDSKFLENVGGVLEGEILTAPQAVRQLDDNVRIAPSGAGRIDAFLPVNHASFGAARYSRSVLEQAASTGHVGRMSGLRQKEINHAEKLQL